MTTPPPRRPATLPVQRLTDVVGTEQDERAARWDAIARENPSLSVAEVTAREQADFEQTRARRARGERAPANVGSFLAQGATLGFADEGVAALRTAKARLDGSDNRPVAEMYRDRVSEERDRLRTYRQANPGKAIIAELLGGVATGGGAIAGAARTGAARVVPSLAARVARGTAAGGLTGAAAGAGTSEGQTAGEVAFDATVGGMLGAATGGALPVAGAAVRGAGRAVTAGVRTGATRAANAGRGGALMEALAARMAPKAGAPSDAGLLRTARALREDGIEPAALATAGDAAAGSPVRGAEVVADLAGDQTRRIMRGSEAMPSAGASRIRETLRGRQQAQPDRVQRAILEAFGAQDAPDLVAASRTLRQRTHAASRPAYAEAFGAPENPTVVPRSLLAPYLEIPEFQRALREGLEQVKLDRATGDLAVDGPFWRESVTEVLQDGTPVIELAENVPVAVVDYLKRGLDQVIKRGLRASDAGNSISGARARSLTMLRNQLLDGVDNTLGGGDAARSPYRAARRVFADGIELEEALDAGRDAMRRGLTRDELRAALDELPDAAQQQFRLGALGQLLEDAAGVRDGRDVMSVIQGTPVLREKLRVLAPTDDGRDLLADLVASEGRMTQTRRMVEGSRTAPLQQDIAALTDNSLPDAVSRIPKSFREVPSAIADEIMRRRRNQMADELGPLLMSPARDARAIAGRISAAEQRAVRGAGRSRAISGAAGATTGNAATRPRP